MRSSKQIGKKRKKISPCGKMGKETIVYKKKFSTKDTWLSIRENHPSCHWHQAIWFKHATPKYSVVTWIAMKGRLTTGERMQHWNGSVDVSCVFCKAPLETIGHLFFECAYSREIWGGLTRSIFKEKYSVDWIEIVRMLSNGLDWDRIQKFIMRYLFQSAVHSIWRERNRRRHGEEATPVGVLTKRLDKNLRNQLTVIQRRGDKDYKEGMAYWFSTRL